MSDLLKKTDCKVPSSCSGQDSGVSSVDGSSQCQASPSNRSKLRSYSTSTPKKGVQFLETFKEYKVLPSQMILDDPLLSSIDESDLTDQEVKSLTSDEESGGSTSKQWDTQIKADLASTSISYSSLSKPSNGRTTRANVKKSHSFSGVPKCESPQLDINSIKKNLFDIPVSPKLKSRVRQRLYTLVNSIDGYEGRINLEEEEKTICNSDVYKSENVCIASNPCFAVSKKHSHQYDTLTNHSLSQLAVDKSSGILCNNQRHNVSNNLVNISAHSLDTSQKIGSAISCVLESQLRTLHLHQEQLSKEHLNFALQKKEEELDARISLYRDKLQQMVKLVEDMELKLKSSERERETQKEAYKKKIDSLNEEHKESLALQKLECEKKIHEAETKIAAVRLDVTKSCDNKIFEILKLTREGTAAMEKEHQGRLQELNAIISKLRESHNSLEDRLEKLQASSSQEIYKLTNALKSLEKRISDVVIENKELQEQKGRMETKLKKQQENQSSVGDLEKEIVSLRMQLRDSKTSFLREKQNHWHFAQEHSKQLVHMKERQDKEIIQYKLSMERERSLAVSRAMAHREEETKVLLKGIESRYEELLSGVQGHFKAQIEEYKKAVKILKLKVKNMEEGNVL